MREELYYLKESMSGFVTDGRFCLTLTNKILEVLLEALLVLQVTHSYIIIRLTVIQLWEECPLTNQMWGELIW